MSLVLALNAMPTRLSALLMLPMPRRKSSFKLIGAYPHCTALQCCIGHSHCWGLIICAMLHCHWGGIHFEIISKCLFCLLSLHLLVHIFLMLRNAWNYELSHKYFTVMRLWLAPHFYALIMYSICLALQFLFCPTTKIVASHSFKFLKTNLGGVRHWFLKIACSAFRLMNLNVVLNFRFVNMNV